jgi:hypothetical protein
MGSVTFNIVSTRPDGEYCLYLVEEPPVEVEFIDRLRAIQSRLYEAVEAVIQGKVAELYPESAGRRVHIRLSCFDLPREPLDQFFARFTKIMRTHEEWRVPCEIIEFEITHDTLQKKADPVGTDNDRAAPGRV